MSSNGTTLPGPAAVHLAGPPDARLHFSGPPGNVTGSVPLINTSSEKQKVHGIAMRSEQLLGAARIPIREMPFAARVNGGEQVSVPATLSLDPHTPPGAYDFELTVGDRTLGATAHVTEVVDLRVNPTRITILAGSATSYKRTLVVENAGNVPLPTGAQCEAPLFDSFDLVSTLLIGLSKGDRRSAESMCLAFLNEWADLRVGTLITRREAMILAPGQKLSGEVEFILPESLKPLRHYRAGLQLYNATIAVDIYTTAKAGSGKNYTKSERGGATK